MIVPPSRRRHTFVLFGPFGAHLETPDADGVERRLAGADAEEVPDPRHPLSQGALARLRSEALERPRVSRLPTALGIVVVSIVCPASVVGAALAARHLRLPPWGTMSVVVGTIALGSAVLVLALPRLVASSLRDRADLLARLLLRLRRCPSCGYPLAADAVADDRRIGCSECGAAWSTEWLGPQVVPGVVGSPRTIFRMLCSSSLQVRRGRRDDAGRPYALPVSLHNSMQCALPGDAVMRRAQWPVLFLLLGFILTIVATILAVIWMAVHRRLGTGAAITIAVVVIALTLAAVFAGERRAGARARAELIRRRICPACRQRLRREAEGLRCSCCDARWNRQRRPRAHR